jgi:hypothetical protein
MIKLLYIVLAVLPPVLSLLLDTPFKSWYLIMWGINALLQYNFYQSTK